MTSNQQLVFDPKNPPETLPISQIIIGERFRQDLGDLASLVSSIKEIGLLHTIVIDENRKLIAGRRRLASCEILGWDEIPIRVVNLGDLIQGEFHENHVRKDFTKKEVLAIHHALTPKLKEESKINSLNNLKQNHRSAESAPRKNKKSRDIIAEYAGLSHDSISKLEEIEEESKTNPQYGKLLDDIDNDSKKETINSVFKKLQKDKKRKERHEQLKKIQVKLPQNVQLFNQPFQQNKIKDNSVSLIFTDPPYDKKSLYLYEELAKQAAKVLRDNGSLMCYIGHYTIKQIIDMMEKHGLKFHWPVAVEHSGPSSTMWNEHILVGYKLMLWFTKGKYEGEFVKDHIKSKFQGKELHEWAQSTKESDYYIKYLTIEDEIVYDPFLGQGTFGISAVKLNRQFIGSEIDKRHFENAQKLITIASKNQEKKK